MFYHSFLHCIVLTRLMFPVAVLTKYIAKWVETTPQILEMFVFKDNHMFT